MSEVPPWNSGKYAVTGSSNRTRPVSTSFIMAGVVATLAHYAVLLALVALLIPRAATALDPVDLAAATHAVVLERMDQRHHRDDILADRPQCEVLDTAGLLAERIRIEAELVVEEIARFAAIDDDAGMAAFL